MCVCINILFVHLKKHALFFTEIINNYTKSKNVNLNLK